MGTPNKPCSDCPFRIENTGSMCPMLVDQMAVNAEYLQGFPCHKRNPGKDILTCESPEPNANDCVGYRMMRVNGGAAADAHPEVVGSFDE